MGDNLFAFYTRAASSSKGEARARHGTVIIARLFLAGFRSTGGNFHQPNGVELNIAVAALFSVQCPEQSHLGLITNEFSRLNLVTILKQTAFTFETCKVHAQNSPRICCTKFPLGFPTFSDPNKHQIAPTDPSHVNNVSRAPPL